MPTYARNFLTKVICRVDYPAILTLREHEPAEFQEAIRQEYPRLARQQGIQIELQGGTPAARVSEPPAWIFEDVAQQDMVTLAADFIAFTAKTYIDFPGFLAKFSRVYSAFVGAYNPPIVSRVGLRYVNEILFPNGNPFEWDGLINSHLAASLQAFPDSQDSISRSMHQLQLNKEHCRIIIHFGVFNSEFPNTITRKEFVLDYDCFSQDERTPGDVLDVLRTFNGECENLFEASIGNDLREIMGREG